MRLQYRNSGQEGAAPAVVIAPVAEKWHKQLPLQNARVIGPDTFPISYFTGSVQCPSNCLTLIQSDRVRNDVTDRLRMLTGEIRSRFSVDDRECGGEMLSFRYVSAVSLGRRVATPGCLRHRRCLASRRRSAVESRNRAPATMEWHKSNEQRDDHTVAHRTVEQQAVATSKSNSSLVLNVHQEGERKL